MMSIREFVVLVLFGSAIAVAGQDAALLQRVGWDPLPDSMITAWRLPHDQVKRLLVIEEDFNAEREAVMTDTALTDAAREARLTELATMRRKEIRAVLPMRQFDDWVREDRH